MSLKTKVKRKLSEQEILDVLDSLPKQSTLHTDIQLSVYENLRNKIHSQLIHIQLYPELIPKLKKELETRYFKSLVCPGEMVGMTAAQSIGHNLTQLTLDSFHSAGNITKAVVTGVPKFLKLINASEDTKGDSAIVYFQSKPSTLENIKKLAYNHFVYTCFKDIVTKFKIVSNTEKREWYNVYFQLHESKKFNLDEYDYRIEFKLNPKILFNRFLFLSDVCGKLSTYEDIQSKFNPKNLLYQFLSLFDVCDKLSIYEDIACIPTDFKTCEVHVFVSTKNVDKKLLKTNLNSIELYLEDVVVEELYKIRLCGIEGISNIFFNVNKENEWFVETEGTNLLEIFTIPNVDVKRTTSNSIWEIYRIFGIEAARTVLVSEFKDVISSDGTYIHLRHIQLLVNGMTFLGKIHSASRYGISKEQVGPLAKVSFEESLNNFVLAASIGEKESTVGVASAIMCSRIPSIGSGMCELLLDHNKAMLAPVVSHVSKFSRNTSSIPLKQRPKVSTKLPSVKEEYKPLLQNTNLLLHNSIQVQHLQNTNLLHRNTNLLLHNSIQVQHLQNTNLLHL